MEALEDRLTYKSRLTEREKEWLKAYFEAEGNATEATRKVYGGTPGACRVKGHKKLKKLESLITVIRERGFERMEYRGITGIEFFLGDLERHQEEARRFWKEVDGPMGLIRLAEGG